MQVICILLGVPEADRHELFEAVEPGFDFRDGRESLEPTTGRRRADMDVEYGARAHRREARPTRPTTCSRSSCTPRSPTRTRPARPTTSCTCSSACCSRPARETTRNAIAGGLLALARTSRPARRAARRSRAAAGTAIEEMLRWTTPSPSKRRTATRAAELARPHRSRRATRSCSGRARPTATSSCSTEPTQFDIARDPEPAPRVRPRAALLPGRQPGPPGDAGDVRGAARRFATIELAGAGRVDPQQPPHRHPPPPPHPHPAEPTSFLRQSSEYWLTSTHVRGVKCGQCSRGTA